MGHGHAHGHGHQQDDWDARAADYDAVVDLMEPELGKASTALMEAARVGPGTKVLDLACGPGHTTNAATRLGADALGIDASQAMIDIARRRFPNARFEIGDMLAPPVGPWDAIVCRMGAHHVDPQWIDVAFGVLSPGGRVAIAETTVTDAADRSKDMRTPEEWAEAFERAGFANAESRETGANMSAIPYEAFERFGHDHDGGEPSFPKGPIFVIYANKPTS